MTEGVKKKGRLKILTEERKMMYRTTESVKNGRKEKKNSEQRSLVHHGLFTVATFTVTADRLKCAPPREFI